MFHKMKNHLKLIVILLFGLVSSISAESFQSQDLPVFDAHIHYSQDVWDAISPQDAIRRLREVGITRALVSSSGDDGTQRLYQTAPEFVIPVLRPYRKRGTLKTWMQKRGQRTIVSNISANCSLTPNFLAPCIRYNIKALR